MQQLVKAVEDIQKGDSATPPSTPKAAYPVADSNGGQGGGIEGAGPSGEVQTEDDDLAGFVLDIPVSLGLLPWGGGGDAGSGGGAVGGGGDGSAEAALPYASKSAYQAGIVAAQQRTEEQVRVKR
jgi:hypothetical protein